VPILFISVISASSRKVARAMLSASLKNLGAIEDVLLYLWRE